VNGDQVTGLLREMLTELRAIREALESGGYEEDEEEDEEYEEDEEEE